MISNRRSKSLTFVGVTNRTKVIQKWSLAVRCPSIARAVSGRLKNANKPKFDYIWESFQSFASTEYMQDPFEGGPKAQLLENLWQVAFSLSGK